MIEMKTQLKVLHEGGNKRAHMLKNYEDIPELARISGRSEEYLKARLESAKKLGPRFSASVTWSVS